MRPKESQHELGRPADGASKEIQRQASSFVDSGRDMNMELKAAVDDNTEVWMGIGHPDGDLTNVVRGWRMWHSLKTYYNTLLLVEAEVPRSGDIMEGGNVPLAYGLVIRMMLCRPHVQLQVVREYLIGGGERSAQVVDKDEE